MLTEVLQGYRWCPPLTTSQTPKHPVAPASEAKPVSGLAVRILLAHELVLVPCLPPGDVQDTTHHVFYTDLRCFSRGATAVRGAGDAARSMKCGHAQYSDEDVGLPSPRNESRASMPHYHLPLRATALAVVCTG